MAVIRVKRGLQAMVDNLVLAQGEIAIALDTGNMYIGTMSGNVHVNPPGGTADVAVKLQTPRTFAISGDGTAQAVSFDGTDNVLLQLVLNLFSATDFRHNFIQPALLLLGRVVLQAFSHIDVAGMQNQECARRRDCGGDSGDPGGL